MHARSLPLAALLLLSVAMFVTMTIEFMPSGLLPGIASDLSVDIALAGQLVTVFALTVVVTATPLAQLTRRLPRKGLLIGAFGVVIGATALGALAPSFGWLLGARVLVGVGHAAFWSVAGAYASYLVPPGMLGRATAITAGGGSLAGVLGGPIGNALGQAFGWRWSFAAFAALGFCALCVLIRLLPPVYPAAGSAGVAGAGRRLPAEVLVVCSLLLVLVLSQSVFSTYLVPWLEGVAAFAPPSIPAYLLATGLAAAAGVGVMGALADRRPTATLLGATGVVLASLVAMPLVSAGGWVVVAVGCLMAGSFGVLPPLLQALLMRRTPEEVRALAIAVQTTAINVGIGGGALLGGVAVRAALLPVLPWLAATGVGLVALGLLFGVAYRRRAM
ncbi:MAG: MFS transporter [Arachnia sp.]